MASPDRVRLVVLFGGQSAEHDVSCTSAAHVLRAVDPRRYDVVPIGITREGAWVSADGVAAVTGGERPGLPGPAGDGPAGDGPTGDGPAGEAPSGDGDGALPDRLDAIGTAIEPLPALTPAAGGQPTVVLPLLHGTRGEDGTVQGLLELAGAPYVGAGVLASALCMDKLKAKEVLANAGLPQVRWAQLRAEEADRADAVVDGAGLRYPLFVKPANLGSSVGVSKVDGPGDLAGAVALAASYDEWVIVEEGVVGGREVEVAVLGNQEPRASLPGEVVSSHDFYDYEDKYLDGTCELRIPAPLTEEQVATVRELAVATYRALRCEGMARVDFFLEDGGRGFLVNEVNTIPGFTPYSMYPKLWEATGLPYAELIDELVRLAVERHERRSRLSTKR